MGSSSVNDEEIRQLEIALKKKREKELNYYKYLQEQDLKNLEQEYKEAKRINEQFKSIIIIDPINLNLKITRIILILILIKLP